MQPILLLETSTTVCSVALAGDDTILALREINEGYAHSENITVFIEEVLKEAGVAMDRLGAVAVSSGPGSYTGLRIGVSTAKGICYALDKPLISVGTLESMAGGFWGSPGFKSDRGGSDTILVPMIDARRMEVYCAVYDSSRKEIEPANAKIITGDSFSKFLDKGKVYFFGDGAMKCKDVIRHENAHFAERFFPSATFLMPFAMEKFSGKKFEDVAMFEPFYLKDFIPGVRKAGA